MCRVPGLGLFFEKAAEVAGRFAGQAIAQRRDVVKVSEIGGAVVERPIDLEFPVVFASTSAFVEVVGADEPGLQVDLCTVNAEAGALCQVCGCSVEPFGEQFGCL